MSLYTLSVSRRRTAAECDGSSTVPSEPLLDDHRMPIFYEAPRSMLHSSQGRPMSREGTFSKAPRYPRCPDDFEPRPMYLLPQGIGHGIGGSHGVVNTAERWKELEDEGSPGPIYYPLLPRGRAVFFGVPRPRARKQEHQKPRPAAQRTSSPPSRAEDRKSLHSRCTFGGRYSPKRTTESPLPPLPATRSSLSSLKPATHPTFGIEPVGRARDPEISPGPGHFLTNVYVPSGPQWTVGRTAPRRQIGTPGPGAYRIDKAFRGAKPQCSTFSRTSHLSATRGFGITVRGTDSPGPALYSSMYNYS